MISRRHSGAVRLHFIIKQIGGYILFWFVVWFMHLFVYRESMEPGNYVWLSLLIPAAAYLEKVARAANRQSLCGLSKEQITNITQREVIFAMSAVFGAIVMMRDTSASRAFLGIYFALYASWIIWLNHEGHRLLIKHLYKNQGKGKTKTLILASPKEIAKDQALQMTSVVPGADLMGYVAFGGQPSAVISNSISYPILGDFSDLAAICKEYSARLLLAAGIEDRPSLVQSLQSMCDSYGMRLVWVDDKNHKFKGRLDTHQDGNRLFLTKWSEPLEDPVARLSKRMVDFTLSALVFTTIFPFLCLFVLFLHRRQSPGPLFYRQKRTGRNGEIFEVYKFRSMHINDQAGTQARINDRRIFSGGAFLRKTSLDEIPQIINVLRGQMSIVGPRPHYVEHDRAFEEIVDDYSVRYFAKPGITGLAQVKGCRGETDTDLKIQQRVRLDNFYLRNWTLWMDLRIICETALHVIFPPKSAR